MDRVGSSSALAPILPVRRRICRGRWAGFCGFLIIGYLSMSRGFAYLGLPWISLYIGEIALVVFLLFGPESKQGRWVRIALRVRHLRRFEWLLLMLLCYGGFEALRGILEGYPAFAAARDTAFDYYPLFLFLGIWVGLADRDFLRRVVRKLAWWNGCYGLAYVLVLSRLPWTMPGTASAASIVPLFTEPYGSGIALLGLLAFEPKLRRVWYLVALNTFVMLGVQQRAEWVGFTVGLLTFAWCTNRLHQMFIAAALVVALLGVMFVARVNLQSPRGRGGRISVDYIVARAVAPISKNLADKLAPSKDAGFFAKTANWRLVWWASIWSHVNASVSNALFGFGYGYPIGELNPLVEPGMFIQTPHNDFMYALGFSGWLGVGLFGLLQLELCRLLLRSYGINGEPFGLMLWSMMVAFSMFTEIFEGPFGAIPFYLLAGMALAGGLLARRVVVAPVPAATLRTPPHLSPVEPG
ncbi:MAG TPA: O-antigen ligase family protein [Candidatus Acidoferrales bacterium]|nr:O-antigen ligase family protein [Candidatus Acidoferrales bacterium]